MTKFRLHILLIALLCSIGVAAQEKVALKDVLVEEKTPVLRSISVGVDILGPTFRYLGSQGDYQGVVQASIKGKFLPVIEGGYGTSDKYNESTDVTTKSRGGFGRIGCDYNMLKNKLDDYRLMLGVRYGLSHFDYDMTSPIDTERTQYETINSNCTAQWLELVFGVDVKIAGPLHMGWSARYRRRLATTVDMLEPLYAPGYGNVSSLVSLMALYTIGIQF